MSGASTNHCLAARGSTHRLHKIGQHVHPVRHREQHQQRRVGISHASADWGEELGWEAAGTGGAVAAGGAGAVAAGRTLLEQGGNAADAAAATLLCLAITDYGNTSIGGEIPLLIYDAKQEKVKVLCGQGAGPLSDEAMDYYYNSGNGIPAKGGGGGEGELAEFYYKAAPVPGFVCLCCTLLRLYGTVSFEQAVAPALAMLDEGGPSFKTPSPWPGHHERLGEMLRKLISAERAVDGPRVVKLQAARDRFYRGDVADELDAWWRSMGCFLRKADLEAHVTRVEDPATIKYEGYTIHKCGPWTAGPMLLQTLRLVEGFDFEATPHHSVEHIHFVRT